MTEFYHDKQTEELVEDYLNIMGNIEALLFVAPQPLTITQLASILETTSTEVKRAIEQLEIFYLESNGDRGLRIQRHNDRIQLTSAPQASQFIERLLGLEISGRLSKAALETLAIIAYQQPVTRPQIDAIRGVNSDGVLKNLLSKGLIYELGRANKPGRPILYSTSPEFLQHFGLNSIEELPPLEIDLVSDNEQVNLTLPNME
jgi:segregation and condensation protein B